ncbi:hypothetical protein B484DRAFT_409342, partial [Ochromonadaceae sp. CCMP2298]
MDGDVGVGVGGVGQLRPGDPVRIRGGELKGAVGVVRSLDETLQQAQVGVNEYGEYGEVMEVVLEVVAGTFTGRTGRVVYMYQKDGASLAVVITDGVNTEIQCNVGQLQTSNQVNTGYGSLGGYGLFDLVALNQNEWGVVAAVGGEKLRVLTQTGQAREVLPSELRGCRNAQSRRSVAYDLAQNAVREGDTVRVVAGPHTRQRGTVRHLLRDCLWVHCPESTK